MSYKPRTLFRLMEEMNTSLFLPHIQRPFVWDEEQMSKLFDSLMRNYPIQTLLFWRTKEAILARKFMDPIVTEPVLSDYYQHSVSEKGKEKVFVLDGQQRLQSLFSIFNGSIQDGDTKNLRRALFNVTSGNFVDDNGLVFPIEFSTDNAELPFIRLSDLLGKYQQKNSEEIADEINEFLDNQQAEETEARNARQKQVRRNCSQLISLLREEKHFWVQELDGVANDFPYKRVREIFVRVNTGGTKLDAGDLMFAAMKEGWSEVEEEIEDVVDMLNNGQLEFDKDFVLKCVMVSLNRGADLDPEKFTKDSEVLMQEIHNNWDKIETTFNRLRDFVYNDLRLYGPKVVRSYNSFVPIFDYLFHNPTISNTDNQLVIGYYFKSQLLNWYSKQTESVIDVLHGHIGKPLDSFPIADIKNYFASRGYATELSRQHVEEHRLRYILLNLLYVQTFGASPFDVRYKGHEPHIDHIYPKSKLSKVLSLPPSEINHIGNYRFVGAKDNLKKKAELPAPYFNRLKNDGVPIEKHLLVNKYANNPDLMTLDVVAYADFRDERFDEILAIAKKVVNPEIP